MFECRLVLSTLAIWSLASQKGKLPKSRTVQKCRKGLEGIPVQTDAGRGSSNSEFHLSSLRLKQEEKRSCFIATLAFEQKHQEQEAAMGHGLIELLQRAGSWDSVALAEPGDRHLQLLVLCRSPSRPALTSTSSSGSLERSNTSWSEREKNPFSNT